MSPARISLIFVPLLIAAAAAQDSPQPQQKSDALLVRPMTVPTDTTTRFNAVRAMDMNDSEASRRFELHTTQPRRSDIDQLFLNKLIAQHPEIVVEPGRLSGAGCYTMRSYRYAREERGSDVTVPVGYTKCTPVKTFELKSADQSR